MENPRKTHPLYKPGSKPVKNITLWSEIVCKSRQQFFKNPFMKLTIILLEVMIEISSINLKFRAFSKKISIKYVVIFFPGYNPDLMQKMFRKESFDAPTLSYRNWLQETFSSLLEWT